MRKKEFTSFDAAAVVRELKKIIPDSRVSNVYQLDAKTFLLKLHKANNPPLGLILEAGKRLHLTSYTLEKPSTPPAFCMALRKYLRDAWLTSIDQYEFERIITFKFKTKESDVQLVLELFGAGNIILTNDKGVILQALEFKHMRDRNILRGETLMFPPPSGQNPLKVDKEQLLEGLRGYGDVEIVRAATRFLGIGGLYAEEILLRAGIDKTKPCNALNATESYTVFEVLQNILSQVVNGKLEPVIVLDEAGAFIDVLPVKLKRYEDLKHQFYSSFNEALDEFYIRAKALEKAVAGIETDSLKREAERLRRIIESQEKTTVDAEARAERERQIGDTIYAHTSELQTLMSRFLTERQARKDWNLILSEISAEKKNGLKPSLLFESFDARNLTLNVNIDGVVFGLALRRSLFENAADFYERGKHAKQKLEGAKNALGDSRNKLAEIEAKIKKAESLEITRPTEAMEELAKRKVKHKEWFEKFRSFISSDGFMVVAGKDAVSNEVLIKKHAEAWDVIFHSDVVGAPFVVIKTEGKEPSGQVLKEAAEFAASFSRGWREGFGSVDVYWVRPEQLSKKGPSGEYVPHGAFVVSGKRNWMRNVPLKLAIGAVGEEKSEVEFIGGPVDAVKAKAQTYTMLIPGDLSGKELLKRVLVSIGQKVPKEMRERIMKASIESIREFVPYGTGRVLEAD